MERKVSLWMCDSRYVAGDKARLIIRLVVVFKLLTSIKTKQTRTDQKGICISYKACVCVCVCVKVCRK